MENEISKAYAELLDGSYDSVDRIVINGYFRNGQLAGGFREWWRALYGGDEKLDDTHLMRMAGRLSRRLHSYCEQHAIPVLDCERGQRKHEIAVEYLPQDANAVGLFLVLVDRASAPTWQVEQTQDGRIKNLARQYRYVKHYFFHVLDPDWGLVTVRMSGHPPFGVQVIRNGHEYISRQAEKMGYTFAKSGNCFTDIMGVSHSQRAAETGCAEHIAGPAATVVAGPSLAQLAETVCSASIVGQLRQVCDRWLYTTCLSFALTTQEQAQSGFCYTYSLFQLEFSHNLLFRAGAQLEQCLQGLIDRTRSRLDLKRLKTIFGTKRRPFRHQGHPQPRAEVVVERPTYDLTIFKLHFGLFTVKLYSKDQRLLRAEAIVHNTKAIPGQRQLDTFPAWVTYLRQLLQRFLNQLDWLDHCFVADETLDALPQRGQLDGQPTAGLDLNQPRTRAVLQAVLALALLPNGFSAAELAAKVREILHLAEAEYRPRHAAYDLRKLRGKRWIQRSGQSRRYRPSAAGLQTMSALILIRDHLLRPVLAGAGKPKRGPKPKELNPIDLLLAQIHALLRNLLGELGFAF